MNLTSAVRQDVTAAVKPVEPTGAAEVHLAAVDGLLNPSPIPGDPTVASVLHVYSSNFFNVDYSDVRASAGSVGFPNPQTLTLGRAGVWRLNYFALFRLAVPLKPQAAHSSVSAVLAATAPPYFLANARATPIFWEEDVQTAHVDIDGSAVLEVPPGDPVTVGTYFAIQDFHEELGAQALAIGIRAVWLGESEPQPEAG